MIVLCWRRLHNNTMSRSSQGHMQRLHNNTSSRSSPGHTHTAANQLTLPEHVTNCTNLWHSHNSMTVTYVKEKNRIILLSATCTCRPTCTHMRLRNRENCTQYSLRLYSTVACTVCMSSSQLQCKQGPSAVPTAMQSKNINM